MSHADLTLIKVFADARTEPHLPSGSDVLLVEAGKVNVAKILYVPGSTMSIELKHPQNETDLSIRALALVREHVPDYLKMKSTLILVCPKEISKDMIWID